MANQAERIAELERDIAEALWRKEYCQKQLQVCRDEDRSVGYQYFRSRLISTGKEIALLRRYLSREQEAVS